MEIMDLMHCFIVIIGMKISIQYQRLLTFFDWSCHHSTIPLRYACSLSGPPQDTPIPGNNYLTVLLIFCPCEAIAIYLSYSAHYNCGEILEFVPLLSWPSICTISCIPIWDLSMLLGPAQIVEFQSKVNLAGDVTLLNVKRLLNWHNQILWLIEASAIVDKRGNFKLGILSSPDIAI